MQREKPAFEVIPNCLSLFPHDWKPTSVFAENQIRELLRNPHCAAHNPTLHRHESPSNVGKNKENFRTTTLSVH